MAGIRLSSIDKRFGTTRVLEGVELEIGDGEFVSLVGPSGCGKSTLLRIIAGLERQDRGTVSIGERPVDLLRASDRNLAMVFQSYALYPHLTVAENIAVPLRMRRLTRWQRLPAVGRLMPGFRSRRREIEEAVYAAAVMLDIAHLQGRRPGQLSGGQRQRVALGRALVRNPDAFLLDEPLSNLDAKLRVHMRAEIAELHRRLGRTFVYVTHDQVEAMTMSDRIAVMMDGAIIQYDTPQRIYNDPQDIRVARFIGSPQMNVLPATRADDGTIVFAGISLPIRASASAGRSVQVGLRPDAFGPAPANAALLTGSVRHLENLGPEVFARIEVAGLEEPLVVRFEPGAARALRPGMPADLTFDPEHTMLFDAAGKRVECWSGEGARALRALGG